MAIQDAVAAPTASIKARGGGTRRYVAVELYRTEIMSDSRSNDRADLDWVIVVVPSHVRESELRSYAMTRALQQREYYIAWKVGRVVNVTGTTVLEGAEYLW